MSDQIMRAIYPILTLSLVAILAVTMAVREPELLAIFLGVALLLPVPWVIFELVMGKKTDEIRRAIFFASLHLIFALTFALGSSLDLYDGSARTFASAALGILMGGALIFMGNYIPKRLPSLDEAEYDQAKVLALKRFTGTAFVLAGLGYIAAWLFWPTVIANVVATSLMLLAVALIMTRRALTRIRR